MVGQFLTGYLKRCGLEAEDVPKVAATFLGAKYCVWAASVALAVRYRPLRRVFLSRSKALFQGSASRPFAERKRLWLVDALDRLEHVKSSGRAAGSSRALTTRASLLKKLPSRVRKALLCKSRKSVLFFGLLFTQYNTTISLTDFLRFTTCANSQENIWLGN